MARADPSIQSLVWLQSRKNCRQQHMRAVASARWELDELLIRVRSAGNITRKLRWMHVVFL